MKQYPALLSSFLNNIKFIEAKKINRVLHKLTYILHKLYSIQINIQVLARIKLVASKRMDVFDHRWISSDSTKDVECEIRIDFMSLFKHKIRNGLCKFLG